MLDFAINRDTCTSCGQCVADCPARIIDLVDSFPAIAADKEATCYRCQHCFAVCPTGALSIFGLRPENSLPVPGHLPSPLQMETLIKGRRSVRNYRQENLEPALLDKLLQVAADAPSGMNTRQVLFTVVDDREKLAGLRDELIAGLIRMRDNGGFPAGLEFVGSFLKLWEDYRVDFLFRGAPHLLIVSGPQIVSPIQDSMIALSYFELFAQANGVGTVWDGLAKLAICDLLPEFRTRLGIPEDHVVGYAMAFGRPAVHYARTAQHPPAQINRY
ncbi:nitroreductase family protein [Geomonas sp. Red32]|uniref:nitroreductase family protein n=1 Tax=Geomonas sp. Red32 TaxID=2912856 RepID=UPI00202CC9FB|nr:nitroreductase family protein [Geomonas sp. Red32]MCM0080097.1 nitroreductase family protein [Geomonas sp. Red32]